jgi:hypothetical protein
LSPPWKGSVAASNPKSRQAGLFLFSAVGLSFRQSSHKLGRMNLPPLNQTLWTLLIASLTAGAGWAVVVAASRIEQLRDERHRGRFDYLKKARGQPPSWYLFLRSWLR